MLFQLLTLFCVTALAAVDESPFPTKTAVAAVHKVMNEYTFTTQTPAPVFDFELLRRAGSSTSSICGYINGNAGDEWTCDAHEYCSFDTSRKAFGCCPSSVSLSSGESTGDYCGFITKCYDSTAYSSVCGKSSCAGSTSIGFCTTSSKPYCLKGTTGSYTGYGCFGESTSSVIQLQATTTKQSTSSSKAAAAKMVNHGVEVAAAGFGVAMMLGL